MCIRDRRNILLVVEIPLANLLILAVPFGDDSLWHQVYAREARRLVIREPCFKTEVTFHGEHVKMTPLVQIIACSSGSRH